MTYRTARFALNPHPAPKTVYQRFAHLPHEGRERFIQAYIPQFKAQQEAHAQTLERLGRPRTAALHRLIVSLYLTTGEGGDTSFFR